MRNNKFLIANYAIILYFTLILLACSTNKFSDFLNNHSRSKVGYNTFSIFELECRDKIINVFEEPKPKNAFLITHGKRSLPEILDKIIFSNIESAGLVMVPIASEADLIIEIRFDWEYIPQKYGKSRTINPPPSGVGSSLNSTTYFTGANVIGFIEIFSPEFEYIGLYQEFQGSASPPFTIYENEIKKYEYPLEEAIRNSKFSDKFKFMLDFLFGTIPFPANSNEKKAYFPIVCRYDWERSNRYENIKSGRYSDYTIPTRLN
jgi:hypothetical protein